MPAKWQTLENTWTCGLKHTTHAHSHTHTCTINTQSWAAFILGQRGPFASRVRYKTWQAFFSFANGFAFAILVINARRWSSRWRCCCCWCCCCCWRAMVLKYFFCAWPGSPIRTLLILLDNIRSAPLLLCVISLCVWHESEWEQANDEWTEWLTRPACAALLVFISFYYIPTLNTSVCVCGVHTLRL